MPSVADLIYACPECSPLEEMRLLELEPDRKIDPDKPTAYRLECRRGCGQWWFKEQEDQPWVKGYGRVTVEKRHAK